MRVSGGLHHRGTKAQRHGIISVENVRGSSMSPGININREEVVSFCRRHHIRKLALFGSVLRDDFRPDSDVDVLVEFDSAHIPGLITLMRMQSEFSALIGRAADFRAPGDLHRSFRDVVLAEAEVLYAA